MECVIASNFDILANTVTVNQILAMGSILIGVILESNNVCFKLKLINQIRHYSIRNLS